MEEQSDMMMIPNTPTLVAEHNANYIPKKALGAAAHGAYGAHEPPAPMEPIEHAPRHRGPPVKDRPSASKTEASKASTDRLPVVGEYLENDKRQRFIFRQKLGDGAMGHVFLSFAGTNPIAIKTEKHSTGMLPMEIKVLSAVKRQKKIHFCELIDYGCIRGEYNYMIISLLGKDLYRLRSEMPNRAFSLNTTTKIAIQTIDSIEELHSVGYLSRDVKPSNFAPGVRENGQHRTIFMFDFGLAKRYLDRDGKKIKSRGEVGWRGTVRYGSLQAHKRLDLGRRDDLECWFYMLVEMHVGELPWRHVTDRMLVGQAKASIRSDTRVKFFQRVPAQFELLMQMIDGYEFETKPDYKRMRALITEIREENNLPERCSWDWQAEESQHSELTELTSVMSDMAILAEQGATNYTDRACDARP